MRVHESPCLVVFAAVALTLTGACQVAGVGSSPSPGPTHAPVVTPSPGGRPPVPLTELHIGGSLNVATDPSGGENACFYGQPFPGFVRISTPQMPLPDGEALTVFFFSPPRIGSYAASSPGPNGTPIVGAVRSTRLAGGGYSGDWFAVSGTLTISQATNLGDSATWGVMAGSLDAALTRSNGTEPITVRGSWGCVIDPIFNG